MYYLMLFLAWFTIAKSSYVEKDIVCTTWKGQHCYTYEIYLEDRKVWEWWAEGDRFMYIVIAAEMAHLVKPAELPLRIDDRHDARNWTDTFRKRWFGVCSH